MVLILNFGSQFAHLLARRVRDAGVKAEIVPFDTSAAAIAALNPRGIILSGGPASVLEKGSPRPDADIFSLGIPVLGVCYGHQLIAAMLGGKVLAGEVREFGRETIHIVKKENLFKRLTQRQIVWFSHGDQVARLPRGFIRMASTPDCRNAAFMHVQKRMYGVQFHPEASHTLSGGRMLRNFLFTICKEKKEWNMRQVSSRLVAEIKQEVGRERVMIGISGGVDSLVAATLIHRAIGSRLHAVFVDTGLLRKGEVEQVSVYLRRHGFRNLTVIDAGKRFVRKLAGITDPEQKRKIIGHAFIKEFERALQTSLKSRTIAFLAQGTIYPDRVESASTSGAAHKIKSHHNLTLPKKLRFKILEPLKDLYKDEVRRVGLELGLPRDLLWRHPFPGPGLGVRIVGEVTPERLSILREADSVFIRELKAAGEYEKIWQAFAVLLPLRSVGVMGDARSYEYMLALRAVDSVDGMSADWHKFPPQLLEKISSAIVSEVRGVNRVLYDVTQKPPATIEYE